LAGDQGDWKKEIRDLVDVLKRLIQRYALHSFGRDEIEAIADPVDVTSDRYKYLQKPLDENSLPSLIA
jgi:hypothetical protein